MEELIRNPVFPTVFPSGRPNYRPGPPIFRVELGRLAQLVTSQRGWFSGCNDPLCTRKS
jgi:hypothetical protein